MADAPTAAFALSLIGGILILLGGIVVAAIGGAFAFFGAGFVIVVGVWGIICGLICILGATWINSGERDKVRTGSILVLIFSILGLFGGSGFFIGFLLALIGSILGLTWHPTETTATTTMPPPPPPTTQ